MGPQGASEERGRGAGKHRGRRVCFPAVGHHEAAGLPETPREVNLRPVGLQGRRGRLYLILVPPTEQRTAQTGSIPTSSRTMSWPPTVISKGKSLGPEATGTKAGPG